MNYRISVHIQSGKHVADDVFACRSNAGLDASIIIWLKVKWRPISAYESKLAFYSCLYLSICGAICAREAAQKSLLRISIPKRTARSAAEPSPVLASRAL